MVCSDNNPQSYVDGDLEDVHIDHLGNKFCFVLIFLSAQDLIQEPQAQENIASTYLWFWIFKILYTS